MAGSWRIYFDTSSTYLLFFPSLILYDFKTLIPISSLSLLLFRSMISCPLNQNILVWMAASRMNGPRCHDEWAIVYMRTNVPSLRAGFLVLTCWLRTDAREKQKILGRLLDALTSIKKPTSQLHWTQHYGVVGLKPTRLIKDRGVLGGEGKLYYVTHTKSDVRFV